MKVDPLYLRAGVMQDASYRIDDLLRASRERTENLGGAKYLRASMEETRHAAANWSLAFNSVGRGEMKRARDEAVHALRHEARAAKSGLRGAVATVQFALGLR